MKSVLIILMIYFSIQAQTITVGSKRFNENYILAEMMAQLLESNGYTVVRKHGLGGTLIAYESLKTGEIDLYPDYSGTVLEAILKEKDLTFDAMNGKLADDDIEMRRSFGFNNTYAIVIDGKTARSNHIKTISDLKDHPHLTLGFSNEFLNREDGWIGLSKMYGLQNNTLGMEHALAYQAISSGSITATDAYSTDGDLPNYDFVMLEDDLSFFPRYDAFALVRKSLLIEVKTILDQLVGKISENKMQEMNRQVMVDKTRFEDVASQFLVEQNLIESKIISQSHLNKLPKYSGDHLLLTFISIFFACLIALPLSFIVYRKSNASKFIIYLSGLFQTIPSLALLALFIPIFGLGFGPAVLALFLYSLLPIIRNTIIGLQSIDPIQTDVAIGIGLTDKEKLLKIELPLALPTILAGIKTATIISIGTATLAAFIGAGGLGEPIITGLTLNDMDMILTGAIPAALLAILTELGFELIEKKLNRH